ncbi:iron chelate uptake ABC transporter family permease subunit [Brachybacterium alimentarium]|uniref:iron chelate uptake ABC transporter family permease subunit n=1 Tax=Brachybacterium alimentarium TaxID=47845 RepID=UPI000DF27B2A|nr:iron chelate uptake ABC transporter family permease subunit [Brachybacterium alimentarium]RCS79313.1 enterochelin ABC transporter permease [Brachybacterium alimentarium]
MDDLRTRTAPGSRRLGGPTGDDHLDISTAPTDTAEDIAPLGVPHRSRSGSGAFRDRAAQVRYWIVLGALLVLAAGFALGLLAIDNPMPMGSRGFWLIAEMRATSLVVMGVAAFCQAVATIAFQTVTSNRIITPSIMGFESLYTVIQTGAVYFLGVAGVVALQGTGQFLLQVALMVALSVALYGWLLRGKYANLQVMLLIGIILGGGLGSVSSFMQRLLTPSEFDVLTARLFGSVTNASVEYLPYAIPLCLVAGVLVWLNARTLNVISLGRDVCLNVGVDHGRQTIYTLVLVSVLMAVSTALIGPMTFFGFLVATLTYQLAGTHDHRRLLPVGVLIGFVVLAGAYFVMNHVFYAQGVVSIIIELVGGTVFLVVIMRKGRL